MRSDLHTCKVGTFNNLLQQLQKIFFIIHQSPVHQTPGLLPLTHYPSHNWKLPLSERTQQNTREKSSPPGIQPARKLEEPPQCKWKDSCSAAQHHSLPKHNQASMPSVIITPVSLGIKNASETLLV